MIRIGRSGRRSRGQWAAEPSSLRYSRATSEPRPAGLPVLLLVTTAVVFLLTSCSDPVGPARQDLRRNLARWQERALADYSFEYRLNCFCAGPGNRSTMVVVRNGAVDAVSVIDEGSPAFEPGEFPTVDELFTRIQEALEREPHSVRAEYHPRLGHPTFVFVDFQPELADEEWGFEVTGLTPFAPDGSRRAGAGDG